MLKAENSERVRCASLKFNDLFEPRWVETHENVKDM